MARKNEAHDAVVESLTQALLLMMEQKPLAQINISELCEKAGVSRVSFYRNFDSMEQILLQHFIRCTDDWWADFKKKDSAAMSESFWSELLEQYRKNKRLVQLLYENGVSHIIKEHIFACCAPDSAPDEMEGYARAMLAGGGRIKQKTVKLHAQQDVTLSIWLADKGAGKPCFLICPGGAYRNCDESEGAPIAKAYNKRGYTAFILRYSVGKDSGWPNPLEDFEAAMEYLTAHQEELHICAARVIAVGLSAGGHLVTAAASSAKNRPYAVISCYGLAIRKTLAYCLPDAPDTSELVNETTCPVFLASSRNDWIVPIENTTKLIEAFEKHFVDYEAHIYGYGLHGFRLGAETGATGPLFCARVGNWMDDSLGWVEELTSGRYVSIRDCAEYQDAHAAVLSTRNSCRKIFANPRTGELLQKKFPIQYLLYQAAKKQVGFFMDTVSLRNLFQLAKVSEKAISKIDEALGAFENVEECR